MDYIVKIDTREQRPWEFSSSESIVLKTGDYTIKGMEDILCLERKGSITEFAGNVTDKRFDRELERMRAFKYAFLVLEFSMADLIRYPYSSGLPKSKYMRIKINGAFILKRLIEIDIQYNVKVILAGDYGKETALSIFKRVIDAEQRRPDKEVA